MEGVIWILSSCLDGYTQKLYRGGCIRFINAKTIVIELPDSEVTYVKEGSVWTLHTDALIQEPLPEEVNIRDVWGFAKDNPHLCSEGYDKKAFAHVEFWIHEYSKRP
jgi:hypothetical protein